MRKEAADGTADRSRLGEDLAEARERLLAEESAQVSLPAVSGCLSVDDTVPCCSPEAFQAWHNVSMQYLVSCPAHHKHQAAAMLHGNCSWWIKADQQLLHHAAVA